MKLLSNEKLKSLILVIASTFIWGFFAHGSGIFNLYTISDAIGCLDGPGGTVSFGRWMLWILYAVECVFRGGLISTPVFNGIVTIVSIAISAYLVLDMLSLLKPIPIIVASGLMVTWPVVTSSFGFMYTAPLYFVGLLIGICGIYIWVKRKSLWSALLSSIMISMAVGTYQANLPVILSILLLEYMVLVYESESVSWKDYLINGLKRCALVVVAMIEYFVMTKLVLLYYDSELTTHAGISDLGKTNIFEYFKGIVTAYKLFFLPAAHDAGNMYYLNNNWLYYLILVLALVLMAVASYRLIKAHESKKFIQLLLLVLVLPLATNFIYVMCEYSVVYSLTVYAEVFVLVFALIIAAGNFIQDGNRRLIIAKKAIEIILILVVLGNVRIANICYLKAEITQERAVNWFNRLADRIQSCEGYDDEMPVAYINESQKPQLDKLSVRLPEIYIAPYGSTLDNITNDYVWRNYMAIYCGFSPEEVDAEKFDGNQAVESMPCYPNDGSIQVIDGVVVIKFGEQ